MLAGRAGPGLSAVVIRLRPAYTGCVATRLKDGRRVLASFSSWVELEQSLADVDWRPPTPDDVSRVKLHGPPATAAEIRAAFAAGVPGDDLER
jgi:hypothetical protein